MNIIFPKDNQTHNYAEWIEGTTRVLFVAGLSGAGKTTMAKDLAEIMGAKRVSLDQYLRPLVREQLKQDNPNYEEVYLRQGIELLLKDNPEGQLIVEGCHIAWFDADAIKADHALVIVNTSFLKSCYQATKRSLGKEKMAKYGLKGIHVPLKFNIQNYWKVRKFSKLFA